MMGSVEESQVADSTEAIGPGDQLQAAREKLKLSTSDVANQLRLGVDIIEALEANNCEPLPAPTFVRGYLRGYARLVKLDEEEVVGAFNTICGTERVAGLTVPAGKRLSAVIPVWAKPLAVGVVVIALAATALIFWGGSEHAVEEVVVETEAVEVEEGVLAMPLPPVTEQLVLPEAEQPPATEPVESTPEVAAAVERAIPVVEAEPAAAEPAAAAAAGAVRSGESVLELHFNQNSWVEVHDGEGKRRIFDMGRQGRSRKVVGKAPFKIFLGKSDAVKVVIDGEEFDHTPFKQGDLARFKVGGS